MGNFTGSGVLGWGAQLRVEALHFSGGTFAAEISFWNHSLCQWEWGQTFSSYSDDILISEIFFSLSWSFLHEHMFLIFSSLLNSRVIPSGAFAMVWNSTSCFRELCRVSSGGCKSEIRVPAWSGPGETSLWVHRWLIPCMFHCGKSPIFLLDACLVISK